MPSNDDEEMSEEDEEAESDDELEEEAESGEENEEAYEDEDEDHEMQFENTDEEEIEIEERIEDYYRNEGEGADGDYKATNGTNSGEEQGLKHFLPRSSGSALSNLLTADVKQTLHPLEDMAERVLKQIESFAHNLDQFRKQSPTPQDPQAFREACKLVKNYQSIAENNVHDLSTSHQVRKPYRPAHKKNEKETTIGEVEEQIARWQLEAETWDLLYQLLTIANPETQERAKHSQETALQSLHRYSSDKEIWDNFLEADHFARECVIVLQWLEKLARSTADLDTVISELEKEADRGQGLWAHGWLYTKETIKGAKRLRSWSQPLDPEDSRITPSLLGSEKQAPLITQLDPDAVIRQGLGLQPHDRFYEQATWLRCWKMLRSGQSWSEIRAWSQERLENWRALSVSGSSTTSKNGDASDDGLSRMMGCRSQEAWRAACSILASDPHTDRYEKAVYALLCGDTEPAYKVCQTWGDFLYVFYNHMILCRYRDFCKQFLRKLSLPANAKITLSIEPPNHDRILNFLNNLRKDERVAEEAKNPYRQIQSAILSKNLEHFFYHHATATANATNATKQPTLLPKLPPIVGIRDPLLIAANDEASLRIISHLYLLMNLIGMVRGDSHFTDVVAVNVVKYIELLREKERIDLIPLYASLLPKNIGHTILAKVLIDVQNERVRRGLLQRMRAFGTDVSAVLSSQWQWVLSEAGPDEQRPIDVAGHTELAPARELWKRIQFSKIPVPAEYRIIAFTIGIGDESPSSPVKSGSEGHLESAGQHQQQRPSIDPNRLVVEGLALEALIVRDLELLISTFDALESWGNLVDEFLDELEKIRVAYLPEIILLYHNSLHLAGCIIGREILAQCMTLAVAIAGSATLTESFVTSGRTQELVRTLALSSLAIMSLKDTKLKKKLPRGATLDIWKIQPIEEDAKGITLLWEK
ncbi:predicted protein [Uncinocarpus reesii 1704]|uniref:Nuclear pore complex protein n=1 Tax=Uncinocarpus reesii (strain UAMH 1704) TaxID=336963 RepID=C4JTY5_UNCRE|nr:uncharacterized protein UREG_05924 [Uncinocarpus reesii 1704]EEP81082.1 predicted protein [Uncinocarpus reesii 1704]